jgi:hypothetical protein
MRLQRLVIALLAAAGTQLAVAAPLDMTGIFEPGRISDHGVFGLTISPDGGHALWVRSGGKRDVLTIMQAFKVNGQWQAPSAVPFSANPAWQDIDPVFSPDGKTIIFQSTRPVEGKPERKGFDIWKVAYSGGKWGQPVHLGNDINTDESESSASIAANGTIYFMKPNGANRSDLWLSRLVGGAYQAPENLGLPVNTAERESNPYVAPDESYLVYFSSDKRGLGEVDLLISFRENGKWGAPRHIDPPINTSAGEFCPWVHDGRLYLSRHVMVGDRYIENIHSFPFDPNQYRQRPPFSPAQ